MGTSYWEAVEWGVVLHGGGMRIASVCLGALQPCEICDTLYDISWTNVVVTFTLPPRVPPSAVVLICNVSPCSCLPCSSRLSKDLPDVEGDKKYNISTFASKRGVKSTANIASAVLAVNYMSAIAQGVVSPGEHAVGQGRNKPCRDTPRTVAVCCVLPHGTEKWLVAAHSYYY